MNKYFSKRAWKYCLLLFVLVTTLILAFVCFSKEKINAFAEGFQQEGAVEVNYLNQEFEDDNFIVVLDKEISKVNKIYEESFFEGI